VDWRLEEERRWRIKRGCWRSHQYMGETCEEMRYERGKRDEWMETTSTGEVLLMVLYVA
jgi:hypothetical protein